MDQNRRLPAPRLHPLRRRSFILGAFGGTALLGMGCAARTRGSAKDDPTGHGRQLGVALLGLGMYAEGQLAPALELTRHCALRGIVTGTPEKATKWQRQYELAARNVYDYASLPSIANNPDIDVVYVVTPTALHAKYAITAAEAGKHVWCEKPMAMNVAECQSIIDACRKNGVSLAVGYRMQHEPNTQTVMAYARDRPYGSITSVRAVVGDENDGAPTWRMKREMGGGALYDLGVYAINAIRYASGEEPVRVVRARQWSERPELFREVDECTELELELPSGVIGYGKASRADSQNELRVEAERGSYFLKPMQAYEGVEGGTSDGKKLERKVDKQQARQMDDDALAILQRREPMTPGEEGKRDVRIIEAVIRAAQTGQSVSLQTEHAG